MPSKVIAPAQSSDGWAHITLNSDDWYVRFYLWLYDADETSINTCKLFWAYLFAPLMLAVWCIFKPVHLAALWVEDHLPQRGRAPFDWDAWEIKYEQKKAKKSSREAKLDKWSTRFSMLYAKLAPVLRWVGIILGVAVSLTGLVGLIVLIINNPISFLQLVAGVVGALIVGGIVFGIVWLLAEKSSFFQLLGTLARSLHHHTCAKVDVK